MRARGADLGIAFDGDADRIGLVDDHGQILFGDQLMVLLARDVLRTRPGATIIADVKASQVLFDEIAQRRRQAADVEDRAQPDQGQDGRDRLRRWPARCPATSSSPIAGTASTTRCMPRVRMLGIVSRGAGKLSAIRDALPQVVNTPELRFDCDDRRKFAVIAEVAARLRAEGAKVAETDGVRVLTADGWWLLRASNTQAVLVARAEAADAAGLERLKAALTRQLEASGLAAPDFDAPNAGH